MSSDNICPFLTPKRCSQQCAWYDKAANQCVVWSFHKNVDSFIKILRDYMSVQLKIQAGREKTE